MLFVVVFPLIVYTVFHIDNIYEVSTENADILFFGFWSRKCWFVRSHVLFLQGILHKTIETYFFFTSKQITESIDSIVLIIRILVVVSSQ